MRRVHLIIVLFAVACVLPVASVERAEYEARGYAARNYPSGQVQNANCQNRDSDGDGYIRCELSILLPNGNTEVPNIECAYPQLMGFESGCRIPKAGN